MKTPGRRRTTASRLHFLQACPGSGSLPWTDRTTKGGERGRAVHLYIERRVGGQSEEDALGGLPEEVLETCRAIDMDRVLWIFQDLDAPVRAERTFVWNPDPAREGEAHEISDDGPREEPDGWQLCRVDLVAHGPGLAIVADVKTYYTDVDLEEVLQLQLQAVAVARALGVERVRVALISIKDDGSTFTTYEDYDSFDLLEKEDMLREIDRKRDMADAMLGSLDFLQHLRLGPHCRWCPAAISCPALARAAGAVSADDLAASLMRAECPDCDGSGCRACNGTGFLSAQDGGSHPLGHPEKVDWQAAWERLSALKDLDRVKEALKARVEAGPIDLGQKELRLKPGGGQTGFKQADLYWLLEGQLTGQELARVFRTSARAIKGVLGPERYEEIRAQAESAGITTTQQRAGSLHAYKKEESK